MIELLLQAERLLSVGLLDKAEQLYRQVAKADPKNSIAVVGLARVTLDRGDDEGALELARRAVAIDPENAAAQRLVARLEEVLEYRQSAESLLFDRSEAVSALQAEVAAEVAAEVGTAPAVAASTSATDAGNAAVGPGPGAALTATPAPSAPAVPAAAPDGIEAPEPAARPAIEPAPTQPSPTVPPARIEPEPARPPVTPLGADPADPPVPPWADIKVPEPEPAPPPPVDPQVTYIPASTSKPGDPVSGTGAAAPTGLRAILERLFGRR